MRLELRAFLVVYQSVFMAGSEVQTCHVLLSREVGRTTLVSVP